jgi:hypothetical protein
LFYLTKFSRASYHSCSTAIDDDLSSLFDELDGALSAFQSEMISSSLWDDVTVVLVSEFARTLMGNSGDGRYVYYLFVEVLILFILSY